MLTKHHELSTLHIAPVLYLRTFVKKHTPAPNYFHLCFTTGEKQIIAVDISPSEPSDGLKVERTQAESEGSRH